MTNDPRRGSWGSATLRLAAVASLSLAIPACGLFGGPKNYENDNDRLRADNLKLQHQLEQTRQDLQRRTGEIKNLRQQLEQGQAVMPDAAGPTLAELHLGRYSGPIDTDGDGIDDTLRIYLQTLDQAGRMLPVAGRVSLRVLRLGDNDQAPSVLAERVYSPDQLAKAYRNNFTGTHYTLELSLPQPLPESDAGPITAQVRLTQASTGTKYQAQQTYALTRQPQQSQ